MAPRTLSYLHNMYNINGVLLPREGMRRYIEYNDGVNPTGASDWMPRGVFKNLAGAVFAVHGTKLYKNSTPKSGTISAYPGDSRNVWTATGFTGVAISSGANNYFIDDATATLTEITDTDLPDITSGVVYLGGRYVWSTPDSIYYSDVNDPFTIESLAFFDAESNSDSNRGLAVIGNDLYVLGASTIERFRNTGPSTAPFQPVTNSVVAIGFLGGLIQLTDKFIFIGRREQGPIGVYSLSGSSLTLISNDTVNEILNSEVLMKDTSIHHLLRRPAYSFQSYGRNVLVFARAQDDPDTDISLYAIETTEGYQWGFLSDNPDNTLTNFDQWGIQDLDHASTTFSRGWSFNSATTGGSGGSGVTYFQRGGSLDAAGVYYSASNFPSGSFTSYMEDYGAESEPFSCGFRTAIRTEQDEDANIDSIEVVYSKQGMYRQSTHSNPSGGDSNDVFNLRTSQTCIGWGYGVDGETEGKDWSAAISVPFGNLSDQGRAKFQKRGGIGHYNGTMGIVIESSAKIPRTIEKVIVK